MSCTAVAVVLQSRRWRIWSVSSDQLIARYVRYFIVAASTQ